MNGFIPYPLSKGCLKVKIIYLVEMQDLSGNRAFKIGQTSNLKRRIDLLQTGCPFSLTALAAFEVPIESSSKVEKELHEALANYRLRGEWFRCYGENKFGAPKLALLFINSFHWVLGSKRVDIHTFNIRNKHKGGSMKTTPA